MKNYYYSKLKNSVSQFIIQNKLRRKGVAIGSGCIISKMTSFGENVSVKSNCIIGENTFLKNNVIIGSNAKLNNIEIDTNTAIESGVMCTGYGQGKIVIGKECYIGKNNVLDWSADITIGDFVHIAGPSTGLWTHSSVDQCLAGKPLSEKNLKYRPVAPIVIENNVYIGGNCTIYPGVTIHHHSIITPNCVVTKDVKSYTMVGGVPGKIIKELK